MKSAAFTLLTGIVFASFLSYEAAAAQSRGEIGEPVHGVFEPEAAWPGLFEPEDLFGAEDVQTARVDGQWKGLEGSFDDDDDRYEDDDRHEDDGDDDRYEDDDDRHEDDDDRYEDD